MTKRFNERLNLILGWVLLIAGILILVLPDLLRIVVGLVLLFWASQILFPFWIDRINRRKR
jgi:hypothetical protein